MKAGTLIFLFLSMHTISYEQGTSDFLKVGDHMPDIEFVNMYNFPGGKAKLSDFKGKLVILDFWNISCIPCIKGFPKMQKLQDKFGDQIAIFLVNVNDTKEALKKIGFPDKTRSTYINENKLPYVKENIGRPIETYFQMVTLPYHVWIGKDGKIIAITNGSGTTEQQIENYLGGKKINVRYQNNLQDLGLDDDLGMNSKNKFRSILQPGNDVVFSNLKYHFIITKNLRAKGSGGLIYDSITGKKIGVRSSGDMITIFAGLFSSQYPWLNYAQDRYILEVETPSAYIMPDAEHDPEAMAKWHEENLITYECLYPPEIVPESISASTLFFNKRIMQEMQNYFCVQVRVEKRTVDCRILVRIPGMKLPFSKGGPEYLRKDAGIMYVSNTSMAIIEQSLHNYHINQAKTKMPFLNETGFRVYPDDIADVRFDMEISLNDPDRMRRDLNNAGFDIIVAKREIEVLVFKPESN